MSAFDVDLFVIGAGSGGVRAARIAASYGAKVIVAEEFRVGGTCVIRGCVPKKLMVYASRFLDDFTDAKGFGWSLSEPCFDWPTLVAAKEKEITRLSGIYRTNLDKVGVPIVDSRAEVEDAHHVRLTADGRSLSARYILVATGGAPVLEPDIPGRELAITSNEVFDLPTLPRRMLIVGGGYIAVEFASIFARLGTEVTLAARATNVLRGFDEDLRAGVRDALGHAGIGFKFGMLPTKIEKTPDGLTVTLASGAILDVDQIMIATGRRPHTIGLGLEKAGVSLDGVGAVKVDEFSKSNIDSIYAVGDVTNRVALTPVAIREGHSFADTIFGGKPTAVDHTNIPTAVFTTPELGTVGLTETQAREVYEIVDIYSASFRPLKATLSGRADKTLMKIVVDGVSDRVLGVHILGDDAGEMAQLLGIAVKLGAKKSDFDETMAVHPTSAEELVTMRTRTARYEKASGRQSSHVPMPDTLPLTCSQCGKPSVSQGLCVECFYTLAVAQTLMIRNEVILANQAAAELDSIVPFGPPTPRMQLPELPKGPIIMHNIHIAESVVGSVNTGTVHTVDVSITYLKHGGNKDLADALQRLTEAIANEPRLISDDKNSLLDQVAYLSDQASSAAKDRKRGMIKAAMDSLTSFAQSANSVTAITISWQHVEPILKSLFGL